MRLLCILIFLSSVTCFAQDEHCGFDGYERRRGHDHLHGKGLNDFEQKIAQHIANKRLSKTAQTSEIITIPVVVHIVHNTISGKIGGPNNGNITEEQVWSQIDVLNEDFRRLNADTVNTPDEFKDIAADIGIEFCLASTDPDGNVSNGITRDYDEQAEFSFDNDIDDQRLKAINYWPSDQYLNIWVTTISGSIIGWAQFPSDSEQDGLGGNQGDAETDGVVMDHNYFGNRVGTTAGSNDIYAYGRSLVHEVGHWLGLFHPWTQSCSQQDNDYVDDTPRKINNSSYCPPDNPSTCGTRDMYENYMDYTYDQCMNLFTVGQRERMHAVLEVSPRRKAIQSSPGCCGSTSLQEIPYNHFFISSDITENGWIPLINSNNNSWSHFSENGTSAYQAINDIDHPGDSIILETPHFNLLDAYNPILEFDLQYLHSNNNTTDCLILQYEVACGGEFTSFHTFTTEELLSASSGGSGSFSDDGWLHVKLNLPDAAKQSGSFKIRWASISKSGGTFIIDNVSIYENGSKNNVTASTQVFDNIAKFELEINENQDVTLELYNLHGHQRLSHDFINLHSNVITLNVSHLAAGIYIARIVIGEDIFITRILIIHG